jgi:hypothetical protein
VGWNVGCVFRLLGPEIIDSMVGAAGFEPATSTV